MTVEPVELDRERLGVWQIHHGLRVWCPIDTPVEPPRETTFFCPACGCWLLDELEPCPACATADTRARETAEREAHESALAALTTTHQAEYEQLLADEHQKRGI